MACSAVAAVFLPRPAVAVEIPFVQPAALDQPRINAYLKLSPDADPQSFEGVFNIEAFYDTGSSGILLSYNTAGFLGIEPIRYPEGDPNGEIVIFSDVGAVGVDNFWTSPPLYIGLAPYHPETDVDNIATYQTVYNQTFGPVRAHISMVQDDFLLSNLDVFGGPLMNGKVVVMDPKPVNTFADTMRTYVYNPGTPYNPDEIDRNPGIPPTSLHVALSFADFSRFTTTTPAGAPQPTLTGNPFVGPNPVAALDPNPPPDNTPGITITYNGLSSTGSWLLDTGAAASMISTAQAAALGVSYDPATVGTDNPQLLGVPTSEQFTLTIASVGGTKKIAGFYLDSLLIRTEEGDPNNDLDDNHLLYTSAPVLVNDITLMDPLTSQQLTLDGILGMNFFVATAYVEEAEPFPIIDHLTLGRFDWLVYDQPNRRLGLQLLPETPQNALTWLGNILDYIDNKPIKWDIGSSFNWILGFSTASYHDGDWVLFTDSFLVFGRDVTIAEPVAPGWVDVDTADAYKFMGNFPIYGFTGLTKRGTGTLTIQNVNTYSGPTDIIGGTIVFAARQNIGPVNVHPAGNAIFQTSQTFKRLKIVDGQAAFSAGGGPKVLVLQDLDIQGAGRLDLLNNSLIVNAAPESLNGIITRMIGMLATGYNEGGPRWAGNGLTSSTAAGTTNMSLGMLLNDNGSGQPLMTSFAGEPVGIHSILVGYVPMGDTNFDGAVNFADLSVVVDNYGQSGGWWKGDLNFDGTVGFADLDLVLSFYNNGTGMILPMGSLDAQAIALLESAGFTVVPEPGGLLAMALVVVGLTRRTGRNHQPCRRGLESVAQRRLCPQRA